MIIITYNFFPYVIPLHKLSKHVNLRVATARCLKIARETSKEFSRVVASREAGPAKSPSNPFTCFPRILPKFVGRVVLHLGTSIRSLKRPEAKLGVNRFASGLRRETLFGEKTNRMLARWVCSNWTSVLENRGFPAWFLARRRAEKASMN